jgi:hypothetical protein
MGLLDILTGPVSALVGAVGGIIDNLHTSDEEKSQAKIQLAQLETAFQIEVMKAEGEVIKEQASIIREEAKGNWLQRSWRPLLALGFGLIVMNNYIIVPYVIAFGGAATVLELPGGLWALLTAMIGGYTVGRSVEKFALIKNGSSDSS